MKRIYGIRFAKKSNPFDEYDLWHVNWNCHAGFWSSEKMAVHALADLAKKIALEEAESDAFVRLLWFGESNENEDIHGIQLEYEIVESGERILSWIDYAFLDKDL